MEITQIKEKYIFDFKCDFLKLFCFKKNQFQMAVALFALNSLVLGLVNLILCIYLLCRA